jgi:CPA2 family monovalent cation:H+ antiporter-2
MVWYLIIQDLAAVLMIAVIPSLAGDTGTGILIPVLLSFAKGIAFLAIFLLLNRTYIPRLQYWVAAVGGKELFLIGTIIFCLGTALITELIGLSFALGAFLAGLVVSDSEFNYQIRAGMVPFRDIFLCIFFVALGMLLDPGYFIDNPGRVVAVTLGIIVLKFLCTCAATCIARYPLKTALYTGIGLAQLGEFTFVILQMEFQYRLVSEDIFYLITTASLLTMALTPFMIRMSPHAVEWLSRLAAGINLPGKDADEDLRQPEASLRNHVVICGYGPIGITIGRVLKTKGIPFVALELNAQTVTKMQGLGVNCFYGDATSPEVLRKVHIERARLAVITLPDPLSAEATVKTVRNLNPGCFILARTRFSRELDELYDHGADAVVQEEYEAGLSMLARALTVLKVPAREITQEVETIRVERDELTKTCVLAPAALSKRLSPDRIILRLKARSKEESIRELVQASLTSRRAEDQETITKAVLEREQIESTGIGDGIAIPHARTEAVGDICICLGTSLKGIDYSAVDGKPVHILLLLVANEAAHDLYVNTLSSIASLFNDGPFRQNIIRCADPSQVMALINEREKALLDRDECRKEN